MKKTIPGLIIPTLLLSFSANADQVILDDLIITTSGGGDASGLCVGSACMDGEIFGMDMIKLKSDDPTIRFEDTSATVSFPANDWSMGITDNAAPDPARFFINDVSGASTVLLMEAGTNGGIALGAGSTIEAGAISIGSSGSERRIVNVADGVDDTDAATMAQFNAFSTNLNTNFASELAAERAAIDAQLSDLQDNIDSLSTRLDAVIVELSKK